jgi:phosphatidylinositol kinase/protein kinase (PI-3  family)
MLFGLGDRHLENIMMTGPYCFHCDFSHVLGTEPGMKMLTGNTMRITQQMIDFLGGLDSPHYNKFKNLCGTVYNTARHWVLLFYVNLYALVYDECTTRTNLQNTIHTIFQPGNTTEDARIEIEQRVDRESRESNWKDTLTDIVHHLWNA